MKKYLLLLLCLFLLAACGQPSSGKKGEVVAKIDGSVITTGDIEQEISGLPEFAKELFKGQEGMSRLVDELVKKELLYAEAKRQGLDKDPDFVKKFEDIKKNAIITKLLEKEMGKSVPTVTPAEAKAYFDSHKDDFIVPAQFRMSQIVVKTEEDAKKALDRIKAGESFNKVAAAMSIDAKTAKSGGDMGFFKRGEMNKDIERVALSMKKNQVSIPLPANDGIHIFVVTEIKGTPMPYDKIEGMLIQQLAARKQQQSFETYIEGLKKNYKVDINKENFAKVNLAPKQPAAPAKTEAPAKPAEKAPEKK